MIVTIGGLPVYDALILDEESGMFKISLVDDPAVMSNFQAFDNTRKMMMYSIDDEEKRIVKGVIMRADFPIYRRDSMGEYYIMYKADTIRQMAEKYLAEGRQNNFNLMHGEDSDVEGVQMVQFFIKDSAKGIAPEGYGEIADGSLFGEFHVVNDEVWEAIKEGTYKGFSLEGVFDLSPEQDKDEVQQIVDTLDGKFNRIFKHLNQTQMSKFSRFKAALAKVLAEFGSITTDKGILTWDGDEDIKVGDSVYIEDAMGSLIVAEDGEYTTADNKVIVVAEGKVAEIKDAEPEEVEMGKISTDKGELRWEGEEDLKEGDLVFVIKDGESAPAEDGDYTTEDGKVIKVADGKVKSITDPSAEVATEEFRAKRRNLFSKVKAAFSESYDDKIRKIADAITDAGFAGYVCEAGEDFAVVCVWNDLTYASHYYKFAISWDAEGNCIVGAYEEVKPGYVPVEEETPAPAATEEEMSALKAENKALKAEVAKLQKMSAAKAAHAEVTASSAPTKTGVKGLDNLARILSAK